MTSIVLYVSSAEGNQTVELDQNVYPYDEPINFCRNIPPCMKPVDNDKFTYCFIRLDDDGKEVERSNIYIVTPKIENISTELAIISAELASCSDIIAKLRRINNGSYNGKLLTELQSLLVRSSEEMDTYLKTWKKAAGLPLVIYFDQDNVPNYVSSLDQIYSLDGMKLVDN